MDQVVPIAAGERVVVIDIIRGFALFGILVMNMSSFSGSDLSFFSDSNVANEWWDSGAEYFRDIFFDGKFNSLFSLLFAIGFTMQLQRLQEKDPQNALRIYTKRLLILLAIGWLHGCLFWSGDVLSIYALLGFALLLVRNWSDRAIAFLALACLVIPGIRSILLAMFSSPEQFQQRMAEIELIVTNSNAAFGGGTFFDAAAQSTRQMVNAYTTAGGATFLWLGLMLFFATMSIGIIVGRRQWIQDAAANMNWIKKVQWWSLGFGVVIGAIASVESSLVEPGVPSLHWAMYRISYGVARVCIMIFYVATIVRLAEIPRWRALMMPFATAGRMPLTNYLAQSVIGTFIFYHWGLGYWGTTGAALELLLAFVIFFGIQVPLSGWYMRRFNYGPMEYVWRVLTYGKLSSNPVSPR